LQDPASHIDVIVQLLPSSFTTNNQAPPYSKELCDAIGESCPVSVLDFPDVV